MRNKIIILVGLFIFGALIFYFLTGSSFGYGTGYSHPKLTEEAVNLFNRFYPQNQISSQELEWIIKGAKDEDTPLRYINHFYDPINNQPWLGINPIALTAKEWAQNPAYQTAYFFSKGDQSWQKAIKSYIKGDKESSFIALGHVLHLIEDMAVPEHTRNDTHLPYVDESPYEKWGERNIQKINLGENNILKRDLNLNDYFYSLALYSNKYFFSKGSIQKYSEPDFDKAEKRTFILNNGDQIYYAYWKDDVGKEFRLIQFTEISSWREKDKIVFDLDNNVLSDYFSLLAPKAVSYGAGVIKLFFEEAERQKQLEEQKSWWDRIKGFLFVSISTQLPFEPRQENAPAKPAQETTPSPEPSHTKTPSEPAQSPLKAVSPENPAETISNPQLPEGGGIREQVSKPETPSEIAERKFKPIAPPQSTPQPPVILAAAKNTENEEDPEEPVSTSTPAVLPQTSIFLSDYYITARKFTVNWYSSSTNISTFDVERKIGSGDWQNWLASTTATSTLFEAPEDEVVYYFRVRATNSAGLTGDWQEISAPIYFYPVVINEIAWAGTSASTSADEWIELYNKTDDDISLDNWKIVKIRGSTTTTIVVLKGKIIAGNYYLIERGVDDFTIKDIVADLAHSFGGGNLANSGENLQMIDAVGNVIDIVDCYGGCPVWNDKISHNYKSIERINSFLPADVPGNWAFNNGSTTNGLNVDGQPINGTPKAQNSVFDLELFYLYPAQNTTATSTVLEWTPSYINNFKEYKVIRSFDVSFNPASTSIVAATATAGFFDESLESETTYYYKISACDLSDYCVFSNVASTTTSQFPFFWAEPQLISEISTSTSVSNPDIFLDSDDRPGIIWVSATSTQARYVKFSKKKAGNSWSQPIDISQDPAGQEMQVLSKDNRLEVLHPAWGDTESGGSYFDVFGVRSENGVWQPARNISQEGTNNSLPAGAIDSSMATHIVWQGLSQSSSSPPYATAIFYRALDSSGSFLKKPEEIPGSANGVSPGIIIDSKNKTHVFWYHRTPPYCDEVFYSVSSQDGSGWSEGKMIFDGNFQSNLSGRPQILINENNRFLLTWAQRVYEIAVAEFDGLASTTPKTIFSTGKAVGTPSLIINNSKKPYVFWSGLGTLNGGIYFSWQKQSGQWQTIKTVLENSQTILWARAVIDSNNIAHLVWGNDHLGIYYTYGKIE